MKVLIADDQALFREGLRSVLSDLDGAVETVETGSFRMAFTRAGDSGPFHLAIIGLDMADAPPFKGLRSLRRRLPGVPIVVISTSEEPADVSRAIACGARGYVLRSSRAEALYHVLLLVLAGEIYVPPVVLAGNGWLPAAAPRDNGDALAKLTPRERDVLGWLTEGCSNKEIAQELAIGEGTVKVHLKAVMRKLDVANRTQAALLAVRQGWLAPHGERA